MRRREFITLVGGAAVAWPFPVRAQQPPTTVKQARVGVLAVSPPTPAMLNAFREGMRERGYIEGQNLSIDVRWSQGTFEQVSALAAELVSANVQVIIAWATPSVIAARRATAVIPIAHGVVLLADPSVIEQAQKIAELTQAARLPTAFQRRENVEAGGLMSYGGNIQYQFRQAAIHVDRILKGAKPADLPVEQPTKYELVINLKTAKALGLDVPVQLQQLADEVIE